jgi:hypothetical protein
MNETNTAVNSPKDLNLNLSEVHRAIDEMSGSGDQLASSDAALPCFGCRGCGGCGGCRGCEGCGCRGCEGCFGCRGCEGCH